MIGLTLRLGSVCSEYVEGKRKRYTNPFAYYFLVAAVGLFLTGMGNSATAVSADDDPPEFILKYFAQIGLICFIPLAFLWSKLFRRAERNLAENYVFSLYTFGYFAWCDVLLLGPLSFVIPSETAIGLIYLFMFVGYLVFAGTVFFQEKPHIVLTKYVVSFVVMFLVAAIVLLPVWINDV